MAAMPRDSSQRYVATGQSNCDRKTRSARSSSGNFVDSLLPTASSGPPAKKARPRSDDSSVMAISDMGVDSAAASVQSLLASSALSSLVFGSMEENGNQSSGCESTSPLPQSGRSSAIGNLDDSSTGIVNAFMINEDEECSPPPVGVNGNGETNGGNYYACVHCNKYFWTETSLKHHSSLYHSEKSFVCEICGKAFRFRSNLAEHRSVHTSLKPYVCKFCGKSSRLKGNLTKHILKHHKKEQNAYIGKDDIIIKKGKKSVKDPAAVDFLEKSMIVLTSATSPVSITTAPLPSNAGSKQSSSTVSATPSVSTGQFSLNSNDLGSAAMHLLSMASKTEPTKSSRSSSKRNASNQSLASSASSLLVNGGGIGKTKSEKGQQRDGNSIFGNGSLKSHFLPGVSSNGKSPSATTKEPNRFPMITSIGEDFMDTANFLLPSTENTPKFDYDEIFGISTKSQPARDVDAIFESLLGRHLGQSDVSYPADDKNAISPTSASLGQSKSSPSNNNGGVGTRCQLCGKHFRKATNLAVHMSIKHNQPPTALPVMTADSPPPPAPTSSRSAVEQALLLTPKFPTLVTQSIGQPKTASGASTAPAVTVSNGKSESTVPKSSSHRHNGAVASVSATRPSVTPVNSTRPAVSAESILQASVLAAPPQLDTTLNGLMTKSGVSKDLKEIRNVLQELKRGLPDVAKLDELLSALDARVDRLERQLETSVNTLYILVQMQTDMNSAFCQFKNDVVQRLKSLKAQHAEEELEESDEIEEEEEEERDDGEFNGRIETGAGTA